jgi:hypothetical protein
MAIEAEVEDPTHLRLKRPLDAQVGSIIVLKIVAPTEPDVFSAGAAALLERAYGEDEPDYSQAGEPIGVSC